MQESMATAHRERAASHQAASSRNGPVLDESDFPSIAGDGTSGAIGPGYSAFVQARGHAPIHTSAEDFPALPSEQSTLTLKAIITFTV